MTIRDNAGAPSNPRLLNCPLGNCRGQHDDFSADRHTVVKVDDVIIKHADAARGHVLADGPRLVGAVNAVQSIAVLLPQIKRTSSKGVVFTPWQAEATR